MEVLVLVLESWTHRRRMATRCRWHRGMAWRLCARKRASASWSRWTTVTVLDARGSGDRTRAPLRGRARGSSLSSALLPPFFTAQSRLPRVPRHGIRATRHQVLLQCIRSHSQHTVSRPSPSSRSTRELTGTPGSPCTFHLLIMSLANESNTTSATDTPTCGSHTSR